MLDAPMNPDPSEMKAETLAVHLMIKKKNKEMKLKPFKFGGFVSSSESDGDEQPKNVASMTSGSQQFGSSSKDSRLVSF